MSSAENSRPPPPRTGRGFVVPRPIGIAGEPTLEEWKEVRNAAFDELRKHPIPESLIHAVQEFRPHAEVAWVTEKGNPASLNDRAEPIVQPPKKEAKEEMTEHLADSPLKSDDLFNDSFPRTAGDALAACLRHHLARLRRAKTAPVRLGKMLPRSTIATIALDILETNELFGQVQGEQLIQLLRELLDVDKQKLTADRQFPARCKASWILAQDERVPTRVLARTLGVNASSISRWRKEPAFRKMIQDTQKTIIDLESRGLWPPKLEDQERLKLTTWRNALAQIRDVLAIAEPFVNSVFALARKAGLKGRRAAMARELVQETNREFPEFEKSLPLVLRGLEAEIEGIDDDLASAPEASKRPL
jgi:hypothetical protein